MFASCLLLTIPMECSYVRAALLKLIRRLRGTQENGGEGRLSRWAASLRRFVLNVRDDEEPLLERAEEAEDEGEVEEAARGKGRLAETLPAVRRGTADSISASTNTDCETNSEPHSSISFAPFPGSACSPPAVQHRVLHPSDRSTHPNIRPSSHQEGTDPEIASSRDPAHLNDPIATAVEVEERERHCWELRRSSRKGLCRPILLGRRLVLLTWLLLSLTGLLVRQWLYIAAGAGAFCTSLLVFVLPSLIYFRVFNKGLPSDHRSMSLCSLASDYCGVNLVPNRVYMAALQFVGVALLLGSLAVAVDALCEGRRIVNT